MKTNYDYLWKTAREYAIRFELPWDEFEGRRVLITGSTGIIGSQLCRAILTRNSVLEEMGKFNSACELILPVRNIEKAQFLFGDQNITYIPWDLSEPLDAQAIGSVDYIVHGAAPTSSKAFLSEPVETILSIIDGTKTILEFARTIQSAAPSNGAQALTTPRVVFLSTMEIYGDAQGAITETSFGAIDPMNVRNSYAEAKKTAECLCASYAAEYGVQASTLRLCQTFGEGVDPQDGRVFADFGRALSERRDITLLTDGSKKNPYLSIGDAISAIMVVLTKGEAGCAYNAANEKTYCSIREMAEFVADTFAHGRIKVVINLDPEAAKRFRVASDLQIDSTALQALGWSAQDGLEKMYFKMFMSWEQ